MSSKQIVGTLAAMAMAVSVAVGVVPATAAAPEPPVLTDTQREVIRAGKFCLLSSSAGDGETSTIQGLLEIEAADERIWEIILDPDSIVASASAMKSVMVTRDEVQADGSRVLELSFLLKVGLGTIQYHVVRHYVADQHRMTFEMDRSRDNDIDWTEGSYTTFDGLTEGKRLLVYALVIDTGRNVPAWLEDELTESSLKRYLLYVRTLAES